jgi:hypothetical protein
MNEIVLARAHGLFNAVTGIWPILHMRSFEAVTGPKTDRWLVRSVGALLLSNGLVQLAAGSSPDALAQARRIGIGTAAALAAIDLVYAPAGRISKIYLLDAAVETGWMLAWLAPRRESRSRLR